MLPSSCVVNKTRKFAVFDIPGVQACQQHQLVVTHPNNAKSFPAATVPAAAKLGHRRRKRGTRSEESRIARSLHISKKKKRLRKSRGVVGAPHPPRRKNQAGNLVKQNAASSSKGPGEAREGLETPAFDVTKLKASECSLQERYDLCRSVGDECIQEEELRRLLQAKTHPICYDGFEPSGRMHIAQGVMRVINVNKLTKAGCHFKFWVADWFAQLNNKMGGDLKKIQTVGKYMIEIWRATGMDMNNVEFLWASEEINRRPGEYWGRVMEVARLNNLSRVQRCGQIMGRAEAGDMSSAQIFYPCMQCADVFFLKADICQLGLDQRKVNMLAREYCDMTKPKIKFKPVILSHHMLAGLKEGQAKMSKSDPDSAIFMEDSAADVKRKIKKAYCPPEVVEANPILDYCKHIIFPWCRELTISPREGEPVVYKNYEDLEKAYVEAKIHPSELKPVVTDALNGILQPVRHHFEKGDAKKLLETVRKFKVTR